MISFIISLHISMNPTSFWHPFVAKRSSNGSLLERFDDCLRFRFGGPHHCCRSSFNSMRFLGQTEIPHLYDVYDKSLDLIKKSHSFVYCQQPME